MILGINEGIKAMTPQQEHRRQLSLRVKDRAGRPCLLRLGPGVTGKILLPIDALSPLREVSMREQLSSAFMTAANTKYPVSCQARDSGGHRQLTVAFGRDSFVFDRKALSQDIEVFEGDFTDLDRLKGECLVAARMLGEQAGLVAEATAKEFSRLPEWAGRPMQFLFTQELGLPFVMAEGDSRFEEGVRLRIVDDQQVRVFVTLSAIFQAVPLGMVETGLTDEELDQKYPELRAWRVTRQPRSCASCSNSGTIGTQGKDLWFCSCEFGNALLRRTPRLQIGRAEEDFTPFSVQLPPGTDRQHADEIVTELKGVTFPGGSALGFKIVY